MRDANSIVRRTARLFATAGLAAATFWATEGRASEEYPPVVAETLGMDCVPACTLCHNDLVGGKGTVRLDVGGSSFGLEVIGAGVRDKAPDRLPGAIMTIETSGVDTDLDMMPDVEELRAGRDPNEPGEGNVCGGGPTYGCGARIARGRNFDISGISAAIGVALALALAARRRRLGER